jgi:hypothetical protein
MSRAPTWTDTELTEAIAQSSSWRQVCLKLGLVPGGYEMLRRHVARLGLDANHLPGPASRHRRLTVSDAQLADAVRLSRTISEVLRRLGYKPNGGNHRHIAGRIAGLGLDTSHFTGRGSDLVYESGRPRIMPIDDMLVANSTYRSTAKLRRGLIPSGLKKPECEECGLRIWRGRALPLTLVHINGNHTDNRLENLRILCPNCHALTETWGIRKHSPV